MKNTLLATFILTLVLPVHAKKDKGPELYARYCSACHGLDGKGATGGQFPPLAGSKWVEGNPKRSVAIVLHGLAGPVEVKGKSYNLMMPPQGAAIGNRDITAILNYVHTAWGNRGKRVGLDLVRLARDEFPDRNQPWTAAELLELFPLPKQETPLENLLSRVYKGQWNQIPAFDKIPAENIEEEHDGILRTSLAGMDRHFGIVWEGEFIATKAGAHEFKLDADDGARLLLNDKKVCEVNGLGAMNGKRAKTGAVDLKKGVNTFRAEYFQNQGERGITLGWRESGQSEWKWLSDEIPETESGAPSIPLSPTDGETVIYRNFIAATTPRAIGFGFPGGLNLAYSADHLAPELLWTGQFIDAGRHWTGRGQGEEPPAGANVTKLTDKSYLPAQARFKGYSLDPGGNPTFRVAIGERILTDSWKPGATGILVRTLRLSGGSSELEIPLGSKKLTGAEMITLKPGRPATVEYKLK